VGEIRLVDVASPGRGLPGRVSPSQVAAYEACPLRYYFSTVLGWHEPASTATVAGNLVHDTLEALYRLPAAERTQERADQLLRDMAAAAFAREDTKTFARDSEVAHRAKSSVENLYLLETPTALAIDPADLEAPVDADVDGVQFGGRIDRRTRNGIVRVTDYKSGRRPAPAYLGKALRQLYLYASALRAVGDPVDEVELLYVAVNARVRRPVFTAILDDTVRLLTRMRLSSEADLARSAWEARTGPLCRFCGFKPACPMFRSAPTPGSPDSDAVLDSRGLTRRARPRPEPLESDRDTAADEMETQS
jgi:putative RecB family exonuclease